MPLYLRAGLRYLWHHPWQIGLAVIGIILGVAVVTGIDLANESALRAFRLSTDRVNGKTTHQVLGDESGVSDSVYLRLLRAGVRPLAPVIEKTVIVDPDSAGQTVTMLGVDLFSERPFRDYLTDVMTMNDQPVTGLFFNRASAVVSAPWAAEQGWALGDSLTLLVGARKAKLQLVALIEPQDDYDRSLGRDLILTDIARAKQLTGNPRQLTRIDVIIENGAGEERIKQLLPAGIQLLRSEQRPQASETLIATFQLNLSALSMLALIVGLFLIYNALTFSVVQRRRFFASLRAVGVTKGQIYILVLGEALIISLFATALGLFAGIWLGDVLVGLVTQSISDLYFVLQVSDIQLSGLTLLKAGLLGTVGTLLAAWHPAYEASRHTVLTIMRRSRDVSRQQSRQPLYAFAGIVLLLAALALLYFSSSLLAAFAAALLIIIGFAILTPLLMGLISQLSRLLSGSGFLRLKMALRAITGQRGRTVVAISALAIAVAAALAVDIMVRSFRETVVTWLSATIDADVYVSAPTLVARRNDSPLPPKVVPLIRNHPLVEKSNAITNVRIVLPHSERPAELVAVDVAAGGEEKFNLMTGDTRTAWKALKQGSGAIVSESFIYKHGLDLGEDVTLNTPSGPTTFRISGVYQDYATDLGVVMIDMQRYRSLWQDSTISGLGLFLKPDMSAEEAIASIKRDMPPGLRLNIRSSDELLNTSMAVFDRTFLVTDVLKMLAVLVSFVGMVSALLALQLERVFENGVLRAIGLTPGQLRGQVFLQSLLMGVGAAVLAIPLGLGLAYILINYINVRSFGWSLPLIVGATPLVSAVILALIASLLAAVYPAWSMARMKTARALRME